MECQEIEDKNGKGIILFTRFDHTSNASTYMSEVISMLKANPQKYYEINFHGSDFSKLPLEKFDELVDACQGTSVSSVNLSHCHFGRDKEEATRVAKLEPLKRLANMMERLDLSHNALCSYTCAELEELFRLCANSRSLQDLYLGSNRLDNVHGIVGEHLSINSQAFAKMLSPLFQGNLQSLSLSGTGICQLDVQCWRELFLLVKKNAQLYLDLSNNNFMPPEELLEKLNSELNEEDEVIAQALVNALRNVNLRGVNLLGNGFSRSMQQNIINAVNERFPVEIRAGDVSCLSSALPVVPQYKKKTAASTVVANGNGTAVANGHGNGTIHPT